LETPVSELIPWPDQLTEEDEIASEPHSMQDVLYYQIIIFLPSL